MSELTTILSKYLIFFFFKQYFYIQFFFAVFIIWHGYDPIQSVDFTLINSIYVMKSYNSYVEKLFNKKKVKGILKRS